MAELAKASEEVVLTGRSLSVQRGARTLLASVELELKRGEVLAILGANGAGKTTLLRALVGLERCTGEIMVEGAPLAQLSLDERARRITYVPQESELHAALPVREVVALGRYASEAFTREERRETAVAEALAEVDVAHLADRPFTELSTGERRRVLLARALATGARTLLLDEPTAALDIEHALKLFASIRQKARDGRAIAIALHALEHALEFADRALLLRAGRVVASGPVGEVLTPERVREVYGVELVPRGAPGFRLPERTP